MSETTWPEAMTLAQARKEKRDYWTEFWIHALGGGEGEKTDDQVLRELIEEYGEKEGREMYRQYRGE